MILDFYKFYRSYSELELIDQLKKLVPNDKQNLPQRYAIYILDQTLPMSSGEVVVFREKTISYQKLLVAVVTVIDLLTEEINRTKFIFKVAKYLKHFDQDIFARFKKDIAEKI
ncbi:hypothetical protein [Salipaludibacillus sp. CF4.18]|uniref:hypothetical protein n=1 Tax=Salipaludibacillus sp. CF4.18 TaxID=3373081 RepID=UPI003EE4C9C3